MKKTLLIISLYAIVFCGNAQTLSIDNIQLMSLRNADAIKEGTEVKGYYFFYISDKIDKKTNEYTLQITDNNLKKIKDIKFQDSKDVSVLESSFNGTDIIFLFYNNEAVSLEYQVYGADGKKKFSYLREMTKKEAQYALQGYFMESNEEQDFRGLYPIEGMGFISNNKSREDKDYTVRIEYFSTEKRKQWSYIPTEGSKRVDGDYLGYSNGIVYFSLLKYKSLMDQKPDSYVIGLSIETGKQIFEKATDGGTYLFYPTSMASINGKNALFGQYFDANDNIMKDKSKGFAFYSIDEKGNFSTQKYLSWSNDIGKFIDVNSKGKIDDFGFMYLHNTVATADGNFYAIGEGYKKGVSAVGALSVLSGRLPTADKVKVSDLILIGFDKDFNIKSAKIYEKNENNIYIGVFGMYSTALVGKILKYYFGGFDYAYTQFNKDNTSFTVCYRDYVKEKGSYKGTTFNSITYTDGKFTTDRINTKSDATTSAILPSRQGQVLILEYFKKAKKMQAHIEKLN